MTPETMLYALAAAALSKVAAINPVVRKKLVAGARAAGSSLGGSVAKGNPSPGGIRGAIRSIGTGLAQGASQAGFKGTSRALGKAFVSPVSSLGGKGGKGAGPTVAGATKAVLTGGSAVAAKAKSLAGRARAAASSPGGQAAIAKAKGMASSAGSAILSKGKEGLRGAQKGVGKALKRQGYERLGKFVKNPIKGGAQAAAGLATDAAVGTARAVGGAAKKVVSGTAGMARKAVGAVAGAFKKAPAPPPPKGIMDHVREGAGQLGNHLKNNPGHAAIAGAALPMMINALRGNRRGIYQE